MRTVPRYVAGATAALALAVGCSASDEPKPRTVPTREGLQQRLERDTGVRWTVEGKPGGAWFLAPRAALPPVGASSREEDDAAAAFLARYRDALGIAQAENKLALAAIEPEPGATGHDAWFELSARGVPVEPAGVTVHFDPEHRLTYVVGHLFDAATIAAAALKLDGAAATRAAEASVRALPGMTAAAIADTPAPELRVFAAGGGAPPRLAYTVHVTSSAPPDAFAVRIAVDDGAVLLLDRLARGAYPQEAACSGKGARGEQLAESDDKSFTCRQTSDTEYTLHSPPGASVNMEVWTDAPRVRVGSAMPDTWDQTPQSRGNGAAVDAFAHFETVLRFFAEPDHQRRSFDGRGANVLAYVHSGWTPWAAYYAPEANRIPFVSPCGFMQQCFHFADGYQPTSCGQPDRDTLPGSAGLDIVAHEFAHAINRNLNARTLLPPLGGPRTTFEQWAIDEALGDVFGALVEGYDGKPEAEALVIGEAAYRSSGKSIRDLANPTQAGYADSYKNRRPQSSAACNADYYTNSTIVSHAFALMTARGITAKTSRVRVDDPIGFDVAARLWFQTLVRLKPDTDMFALARVNLKVAEEQNLELRPVVCAWIGVDLMDRTEATRRQITCDCEASAQAACCAPDAAQACCRKCDDSPVGHWSGDWGTMSFRQVGAELRGVYTYREGTVVVKRSGDAWRGCWSEPPTRSDYGDFGAAEFRVMLEPTRARIDGRWMHQGDTAWRDDWELDWVGLDIPPEDAARLDQSGDFRACP
jgi:Zn-dependent metalloprotease